MEKDLALTKAEAADEKAEKLRYIDLYERKCVECEDVMATLKKKMALIKEMKVDIEQRDKRIDELLLEVESLKGTISELEALRDQLQQELSDSRE